MAGRYARLVCVVEKCADLVTDIDAVAAAAAAITSRITTVPPLRALPPAAMPGKTHG